MSYKFASLFVLLAALLCGSRIAGAQCASDFEDNFIVCSTQNGCNGNADQVIPNFDQYGARWDEYISACCTIPFTTFLNSNEGCTGQAKLANPTTRQGLLELAKSQDIMVTTCDGTFIPLEVALALTPRSRSRAWDPDRIKEKLPKLTQTGL